MQIVITQEDVDAGRAFQAKWRTWPKPLSNYECPTYLALRRLYPDPAMKINVVSTSAVFFWDNVPGVYYMAFPQELSRWIASFDKGATVDPATFEVEGESDAVDK